MTPRNTETWAKPRSHGTHFTEAEQARIRQAFRAGTTPFELARELKCSTRVINAWFMKLRCGGVRGHRTKKRGPSSAAAATTLCIVNECEERPVDGLRVCEKHTFKPPAHLAKMTAGRA